MRVTQEVFPVEYGARFDTALKELMWELLSGLEKLLPVPDFQKVLQRLSAWCLCVLEVQMSVQSVN